MQRRLHGDVRAFAHAPSLEAGRNDAGVVEHQHVATPQKRGKIGDLQVVQRAPRLDDEQPRGVTRTDRAEGDAFLWKFEVEIGKLHGRA